MYRRKGKKTIIEKRTRKYRTHTPESWQIIEEDKLKDSGVVRTFIRVTRE
jgi:hypothetical protein